MSEFSQGFGLDLAYALARDGKMLAYLFKSVLAAVRTKPESHLYDFLFARIVDAAGVALILVGDSLAQVVLGLDSTLPLTLLSVAHTAQS